MNDTTLPALQEHQTSTTALVLDSNSLDKMMAVANVMATAKATVPAHFRNSPGDCLAVVMQAMQWQMNPFAVAQKTHLVSGTLGYEAQLVNAVITSRAPTVDRLHYEWYGPWEKVIGKFEVRKNGDGKEYRVPGWLMKDEEGCGIKVWATIKGESEPRVLNLLLAQARTRNSTLWADDPKQQLAYLATKRWTRLYCPDVLLGVYTPDEIQEPQEIDVTPTTNTTNSQKPDGLPAYTDEQFAVDKPGMQKLIESGRKSPDDVIAMLSSKFTLSDMQKAAIRAISKKPEPIDAEYQRVDTSTGEFVAEMEAAEQRENQ